jgi:predicted acyl esterase
MPPLFTPLIGMACLAITASAPSSSAPALDAPSRPAFRPRPHRPVRNGEEDGRRAGAAFSATPPSELYTFRVERGWMRMPDGVRLAVTYFRPEPRVPTERFPVLVEVLPYRKEDSFYRRDYPIYSWFVRRGYIMAKVDMRGTGSSEGQLPAREYSDEEIADATSVIAQAATLHGSSGAVGMWGKSWGGFNSIQVALRHPPALKAILAMMASDDLFHDDVHYIDGVLHVDQYALQIDHENGLPAPPDYRIDTTYLRERFETRPWLFTYLEHAVDSDWWRQGSLRFHWDQLQIPSFLIGGLLDGYRDPVLRMLDSVRAPTKAEIGPWKHDYPNTGVPGPNVEWREQALRWWDYWLKGKKNGVMSEPRLAVFVRAGQPPDVTRTTIAGTWRLEEWPITRTQWRTWYVGPNHTLGESLPADHGDDALRYVAGVGTAVPVWWNDPTGNMSADDGQSLVYDSPPLTASVEIVGFPRVRLRASADASIADWTMRLEDVGADGEVALVTGALQSGAQRSSRLQPTPLPRSTPIDLVDTLHFTTWTFQPGHRIRLAVANAQFPMAWPTPFAMTTRVTTGDPHTALELPVTPPNPLARAPHPPVPEPETAAPDARTIPTPVGSSQTITHDVLAKTTAVDFLTHDTYTIAGRTIDNIEKEHYETHDDKPADTRFVGDEVHAIRLSAARSLRLHTVMIVHSDSATLQVSVTRQMYELGRLTHERTWSESVPRGIH